MSRSSWDHWPSWVKVVAILLLAVPVVWGVGVIVDFATGVSAGAAVAIIGLIGLVVYLDARLRAERDSKGR